MREASTRCYFDCHHGAAAAQVSEGGEGRTLGSVIFAKVVISTHQPLTPLLLVRL